MPFCTPWAVFPRSWPYIDFFIISWLANETKLYFPVFLVSSQENFPNYLSKSKRPTDYFLKKSLSYSILLFCLLVTFGRLLFCCVLYSLIINGLNTIYCIDFLLKYFISKEIIHIRVQSIYKFGNFYTVFM